MTVADLDRLVSKTELTPVTKRALRAVRTAVMSGKCGDAETGTGTWSISVDSEGGTPTRLRFSFKRD